MPIVRFFYARILAVMSDQHEHRFDLISSFAAAAEVLDAPHSYVKRLAKQKLIPHYRLPDGEIRFDRHELLAWIREHRVIAEGATDEM